MTELVGASSAAMAWMTALCTAIPTGRAMAAAAIAEAIAQQVTMVMPATVHSDSP